MHETFPANLPRIQFCLAGDETSSSFQWNRNTLLLVIAPTPSFISCNVLHPDTSDRDLLSVCYPQGSFHHQEYKTSNRKTPAFPHFLAQHSCGLLMILELNSIFERTSLQCLPHCHSLNEFLNFTCLQIQCLIVPMKVIRKGLDNHELLSCYQSA